MLAGLSPAATQKATKHGHCPRTLGVPGLWGLGPHRARSGLTPGLPPTLIQSQILKVPGRDLTGCRKSHPPSCHHPFRI